MIAQGVSPLRRRPKGFPIALWKPSGCVLSYFWGIVAEPTSSDFAAATDEVGLTRETSWGVSPTQLRERVKGGTPLQGQGAAPLGSPKKRRGSREAILSTRFCGISLRWLRRCTPAKCRAWIPPFQRGWSPARTRPRCTGCRGRSRSPCRNTRRTDAPAHASW